MLVPPAKVADVDQGPGSFIQKVDQQLVVALLNPSVYIEEAVPVATVAPHLTD
jgi:arginine exporter protein ArgO